MKKILALALISSLFTLSGCMLMHGDHMGHHQGTGETLENGESNRQSGGHSH